MCTRSDHIQFGFATELGIEDAKTPKLVLIAWGYLPRCTLMEGISLFQERPVRRKTNFSIAKKALFANWIIMVRL